MLHEGLEQTVVLLQGAWDLAVLGRYFALASLVLCLLALVVVLLRKVTLACLSQLQPSQPCTSA